MKNSEEDNKDKPEEKVTDKESEQSQTDDRPAKPNAVAGGGSHPGPAPKLKETRRPPKKQARRKPKTVPGAGTNPSGSAPKPNEIKAAKTEA